MIRALAMALLSATMIATGSLCFLWAVTGQVPELLHQVIPIGPEARAISGVAKQYYLYAVIALAYGQLGLGLVTALVLLMGNHTAKTAVCLGIFLIDSVSVAAHLYAPQEWVPSLIATPSFAIRVGSLGLSLIAILFGGSGAQRPKSKTN